MPLAMDVALSPQAEGDALVTPTDLGARVVEVLDRGVGVVADPPAVIADPVAPLHVLPVHEEAFVEAARLLEHGGGHQHEGAGAPVHVALAAVIPVAGHQHRATL